MNIYRDYIYIYISLELRPSAPLPRVHTLHVVAGRKWRSTDMMTDSLRETERLTRPMPVGTSDLNPGPLLPGQTFKKQTRCRTRSRRRTPSPSPRCWCCRSAASWCPLGTCPWSHRWAGSRWTRCWSSWWCTGCTGSRWCCPGGPPGTTPGSPSPAPPWSTPSSVCVCVGGGGSTESFS